MSMVIAPPKYEKSAWQGLLAGILLLGSNLAFAQTIQTSVSSLALSEGAAPTAFQIRLTSRPATNVTITVRRTSGDPDLRVGLPVTSGIPTNFGTSNAATITFTPTDWDVFQSVYVRAVSDPNLVESTAVLTLSGRLQGGATLPSRTITLSEVEANTQGLEFSTTQVVVPEGSSANFKVRLKSQPSGTAKYLVEKAGGDADVVISGGRILTFTPSNYNRYVEVSLRAAEDRDAANGVANYRVIDPTGVLPSTDITATEADNDRLRVIVDRSALSINEGSKGSVRIRLSAQPQSRTTVLLAMTGDPDVAISGAAQRFFTPANWNRFQTVNLTTSADADNLNDSAILSATAVGAEAASVSLSVRDLNLPLLRVISPNGGENRRRGETVSIVWTGSGNIGSSVRVELYREGNLDRTLISATENDGLYEWLIPADLRTGNNFQVRIVSNLNTKVADLSDYDFRIFPQTAIIPTVTPIPVDLDP